MYGILLGSLRLAVLFSLFQAQFPLLVGNIFLVLLRRQAQALLSQVEIGLSNPP
ncbi:hypothetical protein [Serratia symbiotica]|uniref:hypothetical protein n=1 Tax=Serratia symbiotica TaxID=138074 RepID=UPI0030D4EF80